MKLVFSKTNLAKAVGIVMKAVPAKTTMNILECILIDATTNEIKFTANDMELGIETIVEGEIIEKGKVAIRQGMSEVQTVSATVHEIAHSKLHDPKKYEMLPSWKVVQESEGGTKHDFKLDFATEKEAEQFASDMDWHYVDENQFEWRLAVEEDPTAEKQAIKNRHTEEVEAESISYAVCKYFGIETGENSFGYIASWIQDRKSTRLNSSHIL